MKSSPHWWPVTWKLVKRSEFSENRTNLLHRGYCWPLTLVGVDLISITLNSNIKLCTLHEQHLTQKLCRFSNRETKCDSTQSALKRVSHNMASHIWLDFVHCLTLRIPILLKLVYHSLYAYQAIWIQTYIVRMCDRFRFGLLRCLPPFHKRRGH